MSTSHAAGPDLTELDAAAEKARGRAFAIRHAGDRCIAKRAAPGRGRLRAFGGAVLGRLMLGYWPAQKPLRLGQQAQLEYEAQRLAELREAGEPVPRVLGVKPGYLLMEDGGVPLWQHLRHKPFDELLPWLTYVAQDLGRFHEEHHWHGGAQLRNHLIGDDGQTLLRIDFEEPLDHVLPLGVRQAIDLYLLIYSATAFKGLEPGETEQLCKAMVHAYLHRHQPGREMRRSLARGHAVLARLEAVMGGLLRRASKDARRLLITKAVVSEAINS
ncbi:tRNA A-37 threonylcarbamoyl transferase component Bud32 [Alkalispirillum mobile]|uniref:tRNA A-37 threonylcarbamoyl transferase component Bud32 n=1 Tax=Alkalispirillum mobile TaxID=85925 RepID=A0A498BXA6_9GAMM|nr:serine/threonine protein phosphatase [Alkalispirillum mobile]RLK46986.1 tRNA A-37 threonylcarbamoyl transferase component Bud32 [Alkalispirillum mobile]